MNSISQRLVDFRADMQGMTPEQARLYAERRTEIVKRFTAVTVRRMREASAKGKHSVMHNLRRGGMEGGL